MDDYIESRLRSFDADVFALGSSFATLRTSLGSASLATNASGGIEWQARYKPFGETRWTSGTLTTNRKFNGTFGEEASLGGTFGDFCEAPPNEVSGATRDRIRRGSGGS
jgi:hypothetical protein